VSPAEPRTFRQALTEERDAARAAAKNAGGLKETQATEQGKATTADADDEDPKAVAKKEWDGNVNNCRSSFFSEKAYVGFRSVELRGRVKRKQ